MTRIFLSHSSQNNAEAIAIRDWMKAQGWDDVFLDLDPERGLTGGDHWQISLNAAVVRCELIVVLVSPDWAASSWCKTEFFLAKLASKAILPVIVAPTPLSALPTEMRADYHLVDLAAGSCSAAFSVTPPGECKAFLVRFSEEGLAGLKAGLIRFGVDATYFEWPPVNDADRSPYRGLRALEADDAGIFFGRDAPITEALGRLRGMREAAPPRLLVILGASGAGKSSFLRAGLLPRLQRDARHFLPLTVIRPDRAVISGDAGFLVALEGACRAGGLGKARAELRTAIDSGAARVRSLLAILVDRSTAPAPGPVATDPQPKPPMLVLSIDQGEELFQAEGQKEAKPFLALLRDLLITDAPAVAVLITIRSDAYERLQVAKELEGIPQQSLGLSPMPKGSYADVIKGPPRRLSGQRALKIEESLVEQLLADIEEGINKDALPLLAFTLERLYVEYHDGGNLQLSQYRQLGGIHGSIDAAVGRALAAADADPTIPKDRAARLALLRHGLIPWIAGIDPDSGAPRRRVARLTEIPQESRRLIELLVDQRLLATDTVVVSKDPVTGKEKRIVTIEPAHEAMLRQWDQLQNWLAEDRERLIVMDNVKRAARDWEKHDRGAEWLTHDGARLEAAQELNERPDLSAGLDDVDRLYLAECAKAEAEARRRTRRTRAMLGAMAFSVVAGLIAWHYEAYLKDGVHWVTVVWPYMQKQVRPYVLVAAGERALKPGDHFRECSKDTFCPEMIVVPAGEFMMGSPDTETGRFINEGPQHKVVIARPFAVAKFDVTFDDWDACVSLGGCPDVDDANYGRETKPLINVSWNDAQKYVAWLGQMTGKPYRLLTEAEWEYAARAGSTNAYSWGDEIGAGHANCEGCGSKWDLVETSPVGSFPPNAFGLHDTAGDVWQWVQDCWHGDYKRAPTGGSEWTGGDCNEHVVRGGSWLAKPLFVRSAFRGEFPTDEHNSDLGFRVARSLAR